MYLINHIQETLLISFDHLISKGRIEVFDETGKRLIIRNFENSNFEKIPLNDLKGKLKVKLSYDNQSTQRAIHI